MGAGAELSRRSRQSRWRRIVAALAFTALLGALSACGSSNAPTSSTTPSSSSGEDGNLISAAELKHYPQGSVQQAFLNFWSDLQYRSWADAAAFYDPAFRQFVGTARIIGAKRLGSSTFPLLKPEIERVGKGPGQSTVYYTLRLPEGNKELDSIAWRDIHGNWQIVYDSRLDTELAQLAQNQVEIERTGTLPTGNQGPSPAAAKAGNEASELQAEFGQKQLKQEG